ncbi:MAG: single-stranded DNA-binding protein [Candidatus Kerfeldbacteria bacterium]|nr:single-stranded DNA-binding protein [Candidatus Kerfeldbacteria bacterium]
MDLNRVTLIGNLTRDPLKKSAPSGQAISQFSLATNYSWQDAATKSRKENVEFHNIVAWGKLADIINQYVKKGSKVYVEGRLRNSSWKAKDGKTLRKTEVVADNLIMLGHRGQREVKLAEQTQ